MTVLRLKNRPAPKSFNNFMDDFFASRPSLYRDQDNTSLFNRTVPVNIKESEREYQLDLIAPGLEKEDFKIQLEDNLLTISAEKKADAEKTEEKLLRNEFKLQSFKRSFTVDETVEADKICAKYVNGILTLNLPKKEAVKEAAKEITIQ